MKVEFGGAVHFVRVGGGIVAGFLAAGAAAATNSPTPALHERFGDWEVTCVQVEKATKCSILQQQGTRSASGEGIQRTIAVEIQAVPDGAVGTLLTPFGVDLAKGVVLRLDRAGPPLPFKTCLPSGCVVPLQFGKEAIQALRSAALLHISFATAGDGRTIDFPISLGGFGQALDRIAVLQSTKKVSQFGNQN
ncbi:MULTISPECIES: invasion associated locus B family protein [unclassified Novosphingobium]|uniref:invasion associated locus B family protein n=1 Tax=unclassified Novosphingobium TaxID=2644732 RepID=UPI00135C17EC|nr:MULTISPECIES: invasion associated locus B family protein [unclassified Novosphingobium]